MFGRRRGEPERGVDASVVGDPALVIDLGEGGTIDLNLIPPRLRQDVWDTAQARQRWLAVVDALSPGPLRERLRALGSRIDAGVIEMHATAARVGEVERVVAALDPDSATADYKAARRRATGGSPPPEMDALEDRFRSVQRLLNLVADAEGKLKLIDARLTASVAKAAELAFTADDDGIAAVGRDVDGLVDELDALRQAFDSMA